MFYKVFNLTITINASLTKRVPCRTLLNLTYLSMFDLLNKVNRTFGAQNHNYITTYDEIN